MSSQQIPTAMLVLYQKGYKFKYKKYYLKKGQNILGSHPSCHIHIPDDPSIGDKIANFVVTDELICLEPLVGGAVYVLSNVKRKGNVMVEIGVGWKYVVQMERDFIVGGRKGLMQVSSLEELVQVKGVANADKFDLTLKSTNPIPNSIPNPIPKSQQQPQPPKDQPIQSQNLFQASSQFCATIPIDDQYNFEPTVPLDNNYEYEATQKIQDQPFQPTLLYDQVRYVPEQKVQKGIIPQPSPQPNSQPSIPPNPPKPHHNIPPKNQPQQFQKVQSQIQFQMPQTIKQDSMPATIKQDIAPNAANINNAEFPPTIQENQRYSMKMEQIRKKASNLTKSQPAYRQVHNSKFQKIQTKNFHSLDEKREKLVDSFEDLFGGVNNLEQSNKTISLKSNHSNPQPKKLKQTHSEPNSENTQKLLSDPQPQPHPSHPHPSHLSQSSQQNKKKSSKSRGKNLSKIEEAQQQQSQKDKKKYFVLGKIQKSDVEKMSKMGYEMVDADQDGRYQFQVLLVQGELKWSKMLVHSLIKGREIKPIAWINNPHAKLTGKLQGFLWQQIDKRKGKGRSIFPSAKTYYLQPQLQQQFQDILQQSGANLTDKLSKPKSKIQIIIIVDEKSSEGRELYNQWKNYKNWTFCSKRMIKESILMGEEILDKYKLDSYSF